MRTPEKTGRVLAHPIGPFRLLRLYLDLSLSLFSLPRHHDLVHGLRLSLRLRFSHEIHARAEAADIVRAGMEVKHLASTDI